MFRIRRALWQNLGVADMGQMTPRDLADALTIIGTETKFQRFLQARDKAANRHIGT